MKSIMNTSAIKTFFSSGAARRLKFGTLGSLMGFAMLAPTTALGWNYSNVPLFWTQSIKPNVMMMIDNSGSMQAISTNEAFQRASFGLDPMPAQNWYWCSGYSNVSTRCTTKTSTSATLLKQFAVLDWQRPTTISKNLPSYIKGQQVALCNVSLAPGAANFYVGVSGSPSVLSSLSALPTANTIGVLVSETSSNNSGTRDACVRWRMTSTGRTANNAVPAGRDYYDDPVPANATDVGTLYYTPGDSSGDYYGKFLLNTLKPATGKASVNFDSATFPTYEAAIRKWDATKDIPVSAGGTNIAGNKFFVIPDVTRMQAAREVAQKMVVDFYNQMNIGLFTLNRTPRLVQAVSNGVGAKTALIGATESMARVDMPVSALDGAAGSLTLGGGTPLASTQSNINSYFRGGSSPIAYRCQKNYAVVMTDGESTDSGFDGQTQSGYDTDAKKTGNDDDGVAYADEGSNRPDQVTGEWTHQNIIPYTIGFGLENNLLKRAPLVNRVSVTKSEIAGNVITLANHGLSTGDYVEVVSNAATGLTNGRFYYAVVVDGNSFKLASGAASGQDSSAPTNWKQKAFDCAATGTTSATGPCLPVSNGGMGATMVMSTGPGKAFFSFTPDQLAQDLSTVFNSIKNLTASASAVSTNTKQFGGAGTALVYQARFNTEDWGGEVAAYQLNKDANGKVTVDTSPTAVPYWSTKTTLATAAQRTLNVFTWKPSNSTGQPLLWGNLDPAQQTSLIDATTGTNVINWLKGANVAGMRAHSAKFGLMGDVLNSDPAFFSYQNFGYTKLPTSGPNSGASTYQQYVDDGKNNRTPMIFVGANDGMLHAFNANTGAETMAFVPSAVFSDFDDANNNGLDDQPATRENKLLSLTDVNYDHRYFVDGNTAVWDAFDGSNWHSFLVGALGKGGRSVFAIDVTDTAYTASDIKWEFTHQQLGYTYGQPMVARLANNKWYAIFPNGLDSQNDQARVFMVNIHNAADFVVLQTNEGSPAVPNGMMSVQVKVNAQRTVTDIYAGDMRGNIWKFDMYDEGAGAAQFPGVGTKLFTAGDGTTGTPQAITGGLSVGKHPSGLGSVIFFGTGKYFETQDNAYSGLSVPQVDSFYAVLDNGSATNLTRAQLHQQSFTMLGNNRQSTTDTVAYAGSEKGWFIDLKDGPTKRGERVVSSPVLYGDRVIFVSIVPLAGASCGGEGSSYLNELSALNGGMLSKPVVDTDNDGDIDADDVQVSSLKLNGLSSDASIIQDAEIDYKIIGNTQVNNSISATSEEKPAGGGGGEWGRGRLSWQQLQ